MLLSGSCHCRNITFMLDWPADSAEIPARACCCSFCAKHGGVWTACAAGALEIHVRDWTLVSRYAFATRTADFHVCSRCGAVPLVTSRIDDHLYAVVSVHALDNVSASMLCPVSVSFDGESEQDRLARRTRAWIANVKFAPGHGA